MQSKKQEYKNILSKYIPLSSVDYIVETIFEHHIKLVIAKHRQTKYGDYKPPQSGNGHIITINYNLNIYSFLLTLLHEIAHLKTWNKYKNRISPHGKEWKNEFSLLLREAINKKFFCSDLEKVILEYSVKPSYSSSCYRELVLALAKYDPVKKESTDPNHIYIETLNIGSHFIYNKNRKFIIEEKLRKRLRCKEISSGKMYLFNPLAKVYATNE